jgi:hypothetical protein
MDQSASMVLPKSYRLYSSQHELINSHTSALVAISHSLSAYIKNSERNVLIVEIRRNFMRSLIFRISFFDNDISNSYIKSVVNKNLLTCIFADLSISAFSIYTEVESADTLILRNLLDIGDQDKIRLSYFFHMMRPAICISSDADFILINT